MATLKHASIRFHSPNTTDLADSKADLCSFLSFSLSRSLFLFCGSIYHSCGCVVCLFWERFVQFQFVAEHCMGLECSAVVKRCFVIKAIIYRQILEYNWESFKTCPFRIFLPKIFENPCVCINSVTAICSQNSHA